jgi:hypothetical protein
MRVSNDRLGAALRSDDSREHLIAHRIYESPATFNSWELEHSGLMRQVADATQLRTQALALRQTALRLIHAKALFEYLRKHSVRGNTRRQVLAHFFPTRLFSYAMVQEHANFLRKSGSLICTHHVGSDVVEDELFLDPMQQYEHLYGQYFDLYCSTLFPLQDGDDRASERALLPLLKHQLNEWRWIILNPREGTQKLRRESEIRRTTGETQRLPTLRR